MEEKLAPELRPILEKINFVERYRPITEEFRDFKNRYSGYDNEQVKTIFSRLGYDFHYHKREKFFGVKEKLAQYEIFFNITFIYVFIIICRCIPVLIFHKNVLIIFCRFNYVHNTG